VPKCLIRYFTATGNSKKLAATAADFLQLEGLQVTVSSIERRSPEYDSYELYGFFFPVHAFGVAMTMEDFIRDLPPAAADKAFVVSVHGDTSSVPGHPGDAVRQAATMLAAGGYDVVAGTSVGMPVNFVAAMNAPSPEAAADIAHRAQEQLRGFLKRLVRGEAAPQLVRQPLGFLFSVIHRFYRFGLRHFNLLSRFFYADGRCDGCGICERLCPAGDIAMVKGEPQWGGKCHACMRCINICPQSAIQLPTGTRHRRRYTEPHLSIDELTEEIVRRP